MFEQVIRGCADPHRPQGWIDDEFVDAYVRLHELGWTHSVETWRDGRLVGGLYGVAIGGLFAGESMFHRETDASKVALVALVERLRAEGALLLDVQWATPHLASLGAVPISRTDYAQRLHRRPRRRDTLVTLDLRIGGAVKSRASAATMSRRAYSSPVSRASSYSMTPISVNRSRSQPSPASSRPSFLQLGTILENKRALERVPALCAEAEHRLGDRAPVDAHSLPYRLHHEPVAHPDRGLERELLAFAELSGRQTL